MHEGINLSNDESTEDHYQGPGNIQSVIAAGATFVERENQSVVEANLPEPPQPRSRGANH